MNNFISRMLRRRRARKLRVQADLLDNAQWFLHSVGPRLRAKYRAESLREQARDLEAF